MSEQMSGLRSAERPIRLSNGAYHLRLVGALCSTAIMLGGCSICDELEMAESWHPSIVDKAKAATRDKSLLASPSAPDCAVKGAKTPPKASGTPEAYADPNLLEAARLELERDCYKAAEKDARRSLESLQQSLKELK